MKYCGLAMLILIFLSCGPSSEREKLGAEEDKIIYSMAKSYFQPLPEVDWTQYSEIDIARIELGKKLFYDKKLSKNQTQNCASCHDMTRFGQDNLPVSPGDAGMTGVRNVPSILNASFQFAQFWDARENDVESQATGPIFGEKEMGMTDTLELINRLAAEKDYIFSFKKAFPESDTLINLENIGIAIGAFERTLLTTSRFDSYLNGNMEALKVREKKGLRTFVELGCIPCHSGSLLGGNMVQKFAMFGYYWDYTGSTHLDKGVYEQSLDPKDKFVFKVPGLRNIDKTGPYFHDGSVSSLEESIRIMSLSELNQDISKEDIDKIVAFLACLTGQVPAYAHEEFNFPY